MNRKNLVSLFGVISLFALIGFGIFLVIQSNSNQAPDDAKAADCISRSRACVGAGCWCGSNYASATCNENPNGCAPTSQWCQSITCNPPPPVQPPPPPPPPNAPPNTPPPPAPTCYGSGNANGCSNPGQVVPYGTNNSCTCTRTTGTLCSCVPSNGTLCNNDVTGTNCAGKGVGAACGNSTSGGYCQSTGTSAGGILNCGCHITANVPPQPPPNTTCTSDPVCGTGRFCLNGGCADKRGTGNACSANNNCLSGVCSNSVCVASVQPPPPPPGGTTAGGATGGQGVSCTSDANCASGFYCQGTVGNKVCQQGNNCNASNPSQCNCNTGGATCTGYIAFSCNQLTNGQCLENPQNATSEADGAAKAGSCGQVDRVWVGGPCDRTLCGGFTIYNQCSGGGTSTGSTTTPPPPPPPPPPQTPYCGDALCAANELCERTAPGASTYKACSANGSAPTGADVSACYGVSFNQPVQSTTCKYCGDGVYTAGTEQCDASAPATGGNNAAQCSASCTLNPVANVCISMTENGVDPVRSGTSNFVDYVVVFQNNSTSNPFPNIRLLVSTSNTIVSGVGRDANSTSNLLVAPVPTGGYAYDAVTSRHTYTFRWEAVSTGGVAVPDASYNVRALTDGTIGSIVTSPAGCTETVTASAAQVQEPLFTIVKTAAQTCGENTDAVIDYTITVTNVGPVTGTIDQVEDDIDPVLVTLGISPTNITPSGSYSSGTITWTGSSFTAGQSKTFTYRITIPQAQVLNFAGAGVQNLATVQYDTNTTTDNTSSFNLRTMLTCTINGIPITGIFDDGRLFLLGLIFIILGFIAYRYQIGRTLSEKIIAGAVSSAEVSVEKLMPFEDRIERKMKRRREED